MIPAVETGKPRGYRVSGVIVETAGIEPALCFRRLPVLLPHLRRSGGVL